MNSLNSGVANLLFLCIIIPYGIVFIPMGFDCIYRRGLLKTILYGIIIVTLILGIDLAVNYYYTHKLVIPAINIVLYNVLGIGGGPEVCID